MPDATRAANAHGARELLPSSTAVSCALACGIIFAAAKLAANLAEHQSAIGPVCVAAGILILAAPAFMAWRRCALRPLGAEVLPAFAYYLSMYHAPLRRLVLAGETLTTIETDVLAMSLYPALALSFVVSLRPGAFDPARALPAPLDDRTLMESRVQAFSGIAATLFGYALLMSWLASVGITRLASASLTDMYLYAAEQTTVTFQWPFIVGGILATTNAVARWPNAGPPRWLQAVHLGFIGSYVLIMARLGARGPSVELFAAIYLVRLETRRPLSVRQIALVGAALGCLFVLVTAMRGHLDAGFAETSTGEVASEIKGTVTGESQTEFDAIFDNHVLIVECAGTSVPYMEGESWWNLPLQMIPRQIVGNKPRGLSAWWIQYLDPERAREGGGRAFGSFAEGYLNFGVPGAVIQVVAVTLLLLALFPLLRSSKAGFAGAAAAILAFGYHCHRSEFAFAAFTARNAFIVAAVAVLVNIVTNALLKPVALPA